jgi:hypothetical protein
MKLIGLLMPLNEEALLIPRTDMQKYTLAPNTRTDVLNVYARR